MSELYDHQKAMQDPMRDRSDALLLAPCGSGKTLAIIYNWLKERPTKHLIYVLPTTTLLKSIKQDIIELIGGKKSNLNLVKNLGYKIVDFEQTRFSNPKLISIATDYGEERESKLYAHDIIITTMDSFIARLYRSSLTPKKFRDLPIARIFNSTIIFDEAQMYDNYTHTLARYTFELMREGGVHHIIMTATLSDKMLKFLGLENYTKIQVPDYQWMGFVGKKQISKVIEFSDFVFEVEKLINEYNISKALIICNTVSKAQDLFNRLTSQKQNVLLLHSKFKPEDRAQKESQIRECLNQDNAFIVSTQVVEAGIDISTPTLITEAAPGDSLVQRIGRCARRKNEEGNIFLLYSNTEKPLPYNKSEIDGIIQILQDLQINNNYDFTLEKQLIESVVPPVLEGTAESKARGIILSAFGSLSAFGDAWINIPTRDATPIYIYFGNDIFKDNNIINNCVRGDMKFLHSISENFSEFKFYERIYDIEAKKSTLKKRKNPIAWTITIHKNIKYNPDLGVLVVKKKSKRRAKKNE